MTRIKFTLVLKILMSSIVYFIVVLYQDNFKPVYFFGGKDFARSKTRHT